MTDSNHSSDTNSRRYLPRPSQDSSAHKDEMKINESALDTKPESGRDGSVLDKNVIKSSLRSLDVALNTDLSTSIQIEDENERTSYLDALRSLYVENAADDYVERKLIHDLLKTQCRDSDLFQASCCCGIL